MWSPKQSLKNPVDDPKDLRKRIYVQFRSFKMDELSTSPYQFRRTQSCRVTNKGPNGLARRGTQRGCSRSKSTRRGNLGTIASLTFSQKQALNLSWRLLKPQASACFRKIFLELEIASPKVKQIFYKAALVDAFNKDDDNSATMEVHIKLTTKFFDELLVSLDDETEFVNKIRGIGSAHAILAKGSNFSSDIWERLGEIAMERVCSHEVVTKTREASRAWRTLIAILIDELRGGFEGELRQHRKSSSTDQIEMGKMEDEEELHAKLQQLRMDYNQTLPYT
ncbi:Globin domain-containing protein [Caenorhabditis elegans]|nr:Globin family profile domain-containing protein [Caenorhabditis elegans]VAY52121.1 Globin family profile domain-containing protein [Caenorhabditis elegans]|eukprot:NP_001355411.1 Globin-like protein 9 [Caenorhabditis elegans]